MLVANDVFEVPLHGVDPVFEGQFVLNSPFLKRIVKRCIHVIGDMVELNYLVKYLVAILGKCHHYSFLSFCCQFYVSFLQPCHFLSLLVHTLSLEGSTRGTKHAAHHLVAGLLAAGGKDDDLVLRRAAEHVVMAALAVTLD